MKTARELRHDIRNKEQILAFAQFLSAEKAQKAQEEMAQLKAELEALEKEAA